MTECCQDREETKTTLNRLFKLNRDIYAFAREKCWADMNIVNVYSVVRICILKNEFNII